MNRTIEDSRAILLGGETIALENGKIEMPPEQAKTTESVLENIEIGNFQEIKTENCTLKDMNFSKEQEKILIENRAARKTTKALAKTANQR